MLTEHGAFMDTRQYKTTTTQFDMLANKNSHSFINSLEKKWSL